MDLCSTIVTRQALCRGQQWFGAGYHMIYAPAAYVVTFARLYSYVYWLQLRVRQYHQEVPRSQRQEMEICLAFHGVGYWYVIQMFHSSAEDCPQFFVRQCVRVYCASELLLLLPQQIVLRDLGNVGLSEV
jgi:hypothetical protein